MARKSQKYIGRLRERIYLDDDDRRFSLGTVAEACGMTGWRVHAWVLMSNHYHLFIETPEPNLVVSARSTPWLKWLARRMASGWGGEGLCGGG